MFKSAFLLISGQLLVCVALALHACQGYSQGIQGGISNVQGDVVPYATVFVPALHQGTTANELGQYQLSLPPGKHEVRFQYLGYKTVTRLVDVEDGWKTIDILFEEQQYRLPEFVVTASGEDPAYYIMRRAIGMSQYYLNQVSAYTCRVYLKGSGVIKSMPALLRRQLEREGVEEGKYFVTETISEVSFELPDRYQTEVVSMRSSGNDNDSSPMAFVTVSLYRDINGIISPLSRNAMQVYRFVLEGSFMENGHQINKIRVIPRRPGTDVYSGTIFIREGSWNLHSVDLEVEQSMFTVGLRQVYNPVADNVWMPVSHNFDMSLSVLGFEVDFTYMASVSDYEVALNVGLDHAFYLGAAADPLEATGLRRLDSDRQGIDTGERSLAERVHSGHGLAERDPADWDNRRQQHIQTLMAKDDLSNREMRRMNRLISREARAVRPRASLEVRPANMEIADSARLRDRDYWDRNRPVPLTVDELDSFEEATPDSTDQEAGRRKPGIARKIILGSQYKLGEHWSLQHGGLIGTSSYEFNTVDGFRIPQTFSLNYRPEGGKRLSISNTTAYAFARKRWLSEAAVSYSYDPFRRASITLAGGRATSDFNHEHGIPPMFNTVTSLYFVQNFLKVYEKDFLHMHHRIDLTNGLVFEAGVEYAHRRSLDNNSDFSFLNPLDNTYTANIPVRSGLDGPRVESHHAAIVDVGLHLTPRHYYRLAGKRKVMLYSPFPTFSVVYKGGLDGLWDGETRFGQLEASVEQTFNLQLIGQFSYRMAAGRFFNNENMFFADYKHFHASPLWVKATNNIDMFRTMAFYEYSTNDAYAQTHVQYDHARILLKRLPFLAGKLFREKIFFNGLITADHRPYYEFGYGVDQVFLLLNAEVVTGFSGGKHQYTGFRIGVPLSAASIRL